MLAAEAFNKLAEKSTVAFQALAKEVIDEVGAKGPEDMGRVMKLLLSRLQGRAPGDQASQAVRQLLQNS